MTPKSTQPSFRGDPRRMVCTVAAILIALTSTALAQDKPGGPAETVVRTAAEALFAPDVPDEQIPSPVAAAAAGEPEGVLPEPRIFSRTIRFATRTVGDGTRAKNGFFLEFSNMPSGSGWISIGPGYRHWLFGDRAIVEASTAMSWREYKVAQGRFEFTKLARSRVSAGAQFLWQDLTQVTYFGAGTDSLEEQRSEYRLRSTNIIGFATVRPLRWLSIGARSGWLSAPTLLPPGGSFKRGNPSALITFADDPAIARATQPGYLHGEAYVMADTRDARSHPAHGGVYRAGVTMYADRDGGAFSFRRYEGEAAHFLSLGRDRVVLAAHGWIAASDTSAGGTVPFYMLPSAGGHNTLRSYADYRFHDRNSAVVNAEARVALFTHIDVAAFVDAGNVAPRVSALNLDRRSWGLGLRLHTHRATFLRVDAAHGTDGWRFLLRTKEPFHLSRLSRRTAAVPFVP